MLSGELPKTYDPKQTEEKIYQLWLDSGFFNPDNLPGVRNPADAPQSGALAGRQESGIRNFCLIMPPPNVTGTLHVGHALGITIEDILIRYQRMRGKKTLWLPGTDHAAIATQSKVEEILYKKENKTRHDLGREEFLKRVTDFAQASHDTIVDQIKRLGASVDWSREAFTLDEKRSLAVRTAFKKMYDMGLIYRGARVINWDPKLQTTVSDEEIEWKEEKSPFYYLRYGPFVISTARPETKFGDKYIVMHPEDERYKNYQHGQKITVEWINGPITATIIKDSAVDMSFGTGVMTITPWHDNTDFEIAERHNLDKEQIIDFNGKLLPIAGEFAGLHIKKARALIVEKLKTKDLLEKIDENYTHRLAVNSRGGGVIEPQVKEQWFVAVNKIFENTRGEKTTLKELMRRPIESGEIKIIPEHFTKTYFYWIDNLRDWCISRQIWYGHRVPVFYCDKKQEQLPASSFQLPVKNFFVSIEKPSQCPFCKNCEMIQDPDTLDTWFSSGLWTFSALGWPEKTNDLKNFHPTDVLETGYDILFFWVARMILMSTCLLGEIPFRAVYLHGLVRDKDRQKMSKSKGNIIDPLAVIDTYGTDALRMALIFSTSPGNDVPLAEEKVKGMKHFANKLWNVARFILLSCHSGFNPESINNNLDSGSMAGMTEADKIILEKLSQTKKIVTKNIDDFQLHEAAQAIYHFTWRELADIYLEKSKEQMANPEQKESTQKILAYCLVNVLKLLHPFMPFVTEEIWQNLSIKNGGVLMIEEW